MGITFSRSPTNAGLIPTKWQGELLKRTYEANPLKDYMGTGPDSIIQIENDLKTQKGDTIRSWINVLPTGNGQGNDGTYLTNEEDLSLKAFQYRIGERGHGFNGPNGLTSDQLAAMDLKAYATGNIKDWIAMIQTADIISALSGFKNMSVAGQVTGGLAVDASAAQITTVNQVAPTRSATAIRYFCGGQTTAGVVNRVANVASISTTTGYIAGCKVAEYLKMMAEANIKSDGTLLTKIRPIMIGGKPHYLWLVDQYMAKAIRNDSEWLANYRYSAPRSEESPVFTDAIGMIGNVIVKESHLLHRRTGANGITAPEYFDATTEAVVNTISVCRSLFLGAQAVKLGWAMLPTYKDGYKDMPAATKWACYTQMLYGVKKTCLASTAEPPVDTADTEYGCIIADVAIIP